MFFSQEVVLTLCNPMDCMQHARLLSPLSLGVCSDSCPLSQWCYLTISFSAAPFSFCLHSFPASWSAGDQHEESRSWQGHVEGSLTKRKDVIRLQGFPLEFPEHPPPPKIRICLLFHSSNILWKKSNQGFSLLHLKGMFQLNPSDSSLACLTGSPDLLQLWIAYSPPTQPREVQSLKAS